MPSVSRTEPSDRLGGTRYRPGPGVPRPEAPTVAFFAAFLGGVLNLVEGLALLAGGTEPISVLPPVSSSVLPPLGGVGVSAGIGLIAAGFLMQENLGQRVAGGVALVALGVVSLLSGGGFLIGAALAIGGGLLAILREPLPLYAVPVSATDRPRDGPHGR